MHWSGFEALKGLKHHAITVKRNKCNNRMFERQLQKEKEQTENIKGSDSDIKSSSYKQRSSVASTRTFNQNIFCSCRETDIEENIAVTGTFYASKIKT